MRVPKPNRIFKKLNDVFNDKQKRNMKFLFVAFVAMALFQVVGVASIFPFINLVMDPNIIHQNQIFHRVYTFFSFESIRSFTIFTGLAMLFLIILANGVSAFTIWIKTRFVMGINHSLSQHLLSVYLSKPYPHFLNRNTADMGKNILSEVNQLTNKLLIPLFELFIHGFIVLAIIVFLFFVDPITTIIAVVLLGGGYGAISLKLKKKLKDLGTKRISANRGRFKTTNEALAGIKATKVFAREKYFVSRYSRWSKKFAQYNIYERVASEVPKFLLEGIAFGGLILLVLILLFTRGGVQEVVPLVSLFAFAGYRLMPALQKVYAAVTRVYFNQPILDTIHRDMYQQEVFLPSLDDIPTIPFHTALSLKGITFWYPNTSEPVLKHISIEIPKNSSVGFVGTTGSGKTTLIDIIMGLLTPQQGEIRADDLLLTKENIRSWQKHIGYVPQDIFLCDDTVTRNIAFGIDDNHIDMERVRQAAKIAALDTFVEGELSKQYDTVIGERGVRLSGGQRQRIGLARALYDNPDVLVLDEATSSLDGATETAVMNAIQQASHDRTMIMIAHRLTTVKNCDTIFLIDKGEIIDSGTYQSLLENNIKFMKMAKIS